jgi:hypothetical protein
MSKADFKRVDDKLDAIQDDFQQVLLSHGIRSLRVSQFRLAGANDIKSAANNGCWRWVCEMTPTGKVCHQVWDPNC